MPGWDSPEYELGGESGGGGTVVGLPIEFYFEDGEYGPQAKIKIRRSHPELTPQAKVEVMWSYNIAGRDERPNWEVTENGRRMVHKDGKPFNVNTDIGRLFKAVKEVLPYIEGFDPADAESWKSIEKLGDVEWGWHETPKRKEESPGKWVIDKDADPKRTLIPISYSGADAVNGEVEAVDLTSLNLGDTSDEIIAAAKGAPPGKDGMVSALVNYAMKNPALYKVLNEDPEGLRFALTGEM